jgi:hypothetical protein
MFCDRCGHAVLPDQRFCPQCGKQFSDAMAVARPAPSRVQEHVRLLGILWLGLSALNALGAVVLYIVANTIFIHFEDMGAPRGLPFGFVHSLLMAIGAFVLVKAVAGFFAGWGLLQREPWARMLTLVLAFVSLFNFPFGTALGIYSLWVLLPAKSEKEYEAAARAAETY